MLGLIQQGPQRAIAIVLVGSFCASLLAFGWLNLDGHRVRAAFMPVESVTQKQIWQAPPTQSLLVYQENAAALARIQQILPADAWPEATNFPALQKLLATFGTLVQRHSQHQSALMPENPLTTWRRLVGKGHRGSCYNDAILFSAMAQATGFHTRLVEFAGSDGLGGSGHSVLEVWVPELQTWVLVDAQNLAYVTDDQGQPVSAWHLRQLIFQNNQLNKPAGYRIHQLSGYLVPKSELWSFYQRSMDLYILSTADFLTVSRHGPASKLAAFLEKRAPQFGLKALQAGRFVRSIAGRPFTRYRWEDDTTPQQTFAAYYQLGRAVLATWLLNALLILGWILSVAVARLRHGVTTTGS